VASSSDRTGYNVLVRDPAGQVVGTIDTWTKLTLVLKWAGLSTWALEVDAGSSQAGRLVPGGGLYVYGPTSSTTPLLTGLMRGLVRADRGTTGDPGRTFAPTGYGDEWELLTRLCRPTPLAAVTAQGDTHNVSGPAETVLKQLVALNAGQGAVAERRVPRLDVAPDLGRGRAVAVRERYANLLDECVRIGQAVGLGFSVVDNPDTRRLTFDVTPPRDLTAAVHLSRAAGTLRSSSYSAAGATGTDALVGGQGQGAARTMATASSPDPVWQRRVEVYLDRRDTNVLQELVDAGTDALAVALADSSLKLAPMDTPQVAFGRDYRLGDRVSVDVDEGITVSDVVRSVTIVVDGTADAGVTVTPDVGPPGGTDALPSTSAIRKLATRVNQLERRP